MEMSVAQIVLMNSDFHYNSATHGGVLTTYGNYRVTVKSSRFYNNEIMNRWYSRGGVFGFWDQTTASIEASHFYHNGRNYTKGGVFYIECSSVAIYKCEFLNNSVRSFGGVISMLQGSVSIDSCYFRNNRGYQGGVLDANQHCSITINNSTFTGNSVDKVDVNNSHAYAGIMIMSYFVNLTASKTLFINNTAFKHGGAIYATIANMIFDNCQFIENHSGQDGGIMYLTWTEITFLADNTMLDNLATGNGGAIFVSSNSIMNIYDRLDVINNIANESGGGFYLYRSMIVSQLNSTLTLIDNRAAVNGGGVFATISVLRVLSNRDSSTETSVNFTNNTSQMGGGVYLALTSQLHIIKSGNNYTRTLYSVYFTANSANYGGAVYVADDTNSQQCASVSYMNLSVDTECFLQVISPVSIDLMMYNYISINFAQNTAKISGSTLYGGLLDRCTLDPKAEISLANVQIKNHTGGPVQGLDFFKNVSEIDVIDQHAISSNPVSICFCDIEDPAMHDCTIESHSINVRKGQMFNVSVVAVDHISQTISNTSIYASLRYPNSGMGEGQMVQTTTESCTTLNFNIYSKKTTETLILYPEGPCKNATRSQKTIDILFLKCRCPIGFSPNVSMKSRCSCVCDPKLQQYITNCNTSTHSLRRDGNFWIAYIFRNASNLSEGGDYLIYPNCPFDYCVRPHSRKVWINLNNTINGSDAQCANSRSGLLCGVCQPNFSLSLGSSRCIPCSEKSWYRNLAVLVVASILAGIGLVALIFILNLTVAQGTLNGLIFYANIIGANESIFFPSISNINQPVYVFVSWLNLELGFDACFIKGMDSYWKTWLQLVFPTYVIGLVALIIFISERSLRFTRLITDAGKNPVAALATLTMLSYAKYLRTIITTLSLAILHYHSGTKVLWLADASVEYFNVKHSILFIVAILILIVGMAYTFLLFFWQWLYRLNFITQRYPRFCHFFEVYHVPYITKYRYWTGLLLVVRFLLYLVFALNTSGDPGVSLLAIIAVTSSLIFLLKGQFGRIYKNWMIDILETTCYLNIILFSATTLFLVESKRDQTTVTFISIFITFVLCFLIIIHHTYSEIWLKLIRNRISCRNNDSHRDTEVRGILDIYNNEIGAQTEAICTFSEIEAPRRTSECLEAVNDADANQENHYCDSDECTPLLMNNEA
jgi:predicted outer membrane repeat protein